MNTKPINDGGSAFPMGYHPDGNNADHIGMSLRDWFAGMALQGMLAQGPSEGTPFDQWAFTAFHMADAMIESRKKVYIIDRGEDK